MQTWRLGLVVWVCWGCSGEAAPGDDLYDIPVEAPASPDPLMPAGAGSEAPGEPASPLPADEPGASAVAGDLTLHGLTMTGELSESEVYDALAQASAVCFGEAHDDAVHHRAQARAARQLALRARDEGVPFALGFEMFQTPFQLAVTRFASGSIDEGELLRATEYQARWGYDFTLYRPLLELARELRLPALALNAPAELTHKIASDGLDGLSAEELAGLPELDLDDADHRAYVTELLGTFHSSEAALENPYTVQVVWDETMADTAAGWLSGSGAGARVLVIAGLGHCHHSAIPARITRRTGLSALAVAPVRASRLGLPGFPTLEHYDMLIVLDD